MPEPHDLPRMSGREDERVTGYRAVSHLAVWALIVGLLSPIALLSPGLMLVPAVALLLAIAGLLRIRLHDDELLGRAPGLIALVLATLCLSAAVTDVLYTRSLIRAEAQAFAERWLTDPPADDQSASALREKLGHSAEIAAARLVRTEAQQRDGQRWMLVQTYRLRTRGEEHSAREPVVRLELRRTSADGVARWQARYAAPDEDTQSP